MAGAIFWLLGGAFSYSLDDAYIHLALAEGLTSGSYGLNPGEVASPSSSIAYPFLVAATLGLSLGQFGPLILNIIGAGLVVALFASVMEREGGLPNALAGAASLFLAFCLNIFGVALSGMEHSLHIVATLAVFAGLARTTPGERPHVLLVIGIIAGPLLRYEGLAVSAAGIVGLLALRSYGWALGLAVIAGAPVAMFSAFLIHLGLPVLPSSVMVKSGAAAAANAAGGFSGVVADAWRQISYQVTSRSGLLLVALAAASWIAAARFGNERRRRNNVALALALTIVVAGHVTLGRNGWFSRYELYALCAGVLATLCILGERVRTTLMSPSRCAIVALAGLALTSTYWKATLKAPEVAAGIWQQQAQMRRFAVDLLHGPVAVNDLGWVSYRNDRYVLDLWGLGSEQARRLRRSATNLDWSEPLVRAHGVKVAMIYSEWFPKVPDSWRPLGTLITPAHSSLFLNKVRFYATDGRPDPQTCSALTAFSASLPAGARFEFAQASPVCASPRLR